MNTGEKTCRDCGHTKPLTHFYSGANTRDKHGSYCRPCTKKRVAESAKRNAAKVKERGAKWRVDNKERKRELNSRWIKANPEAALRRCINRRARKHRATVLWDKELTALVTREAVTLCKLRNASTNLVWHVDHVVPLKSDLVCGLHTWSNLQVIPAEVNFSKSNVHWPDMP